MAEGEGDVEGGGRRGEKEGEKRGAGGGHGVSFFGLNGIPILEV